jgi:hypothetical protein
MNKSEIIIEDDGLYDLNDQLLDETNLSNSVLIEPDRRAKSTLGENSVGRIRNRIIKP